MGFRFYPTIENKKGLLKSINVIPTDEFKFLRYDGQSLHELAVGSGRIVDVFWDQQKDSLVVRRDIKINDPQILYGKDGIACSDSELGLAIQWTNASTSMAGCILPKDGSEVKSSTGWSAYFEHFFNPGELNGIIEFKIIIYLKKKSLNVPFEEKMLNNKEGVVLGELEIYRLQISDETIPFPIIVDSFESDALWWVDFYTWEDPGDDGLFGPSSFLITINSNISSGCPNVSGNSIKNIDMLFEITASVYAMLFKKLNMQQFNEMVMKKGKPGTISAELSRMYYLSDNRFNYNSDYETIHKCMQELIRNEVSSSHGLVEVVDNA